jgi:hypothetical protein
VTLTRLVGWLDEKSDLLSPLVVKEVRQVVRGREFSLSFGACLLAGLIVAFLGATDAVAGGGTAGRWTFGALMFCLAFLGLAVVPLGAFNALRREQLEQTFDLITLTSLSSRRVVVGKLMAHAVRLTTLFAAMAPFVTMSFLLGGIDFISIAISLVVMFMASLLACAVCIFLSTIARSRAVSGVVFVVIGVAVVAVLLLAIPAFRVLSSGLFFALSGGPGVTAGQLFWTLAIVTTVWIAMLINLVLLAVNRLSLATDDSVTYLRLGFLAQLLLMVAWALVFLFDPLPAPRAAGAVLATLGGLHLAAFALFSVTESHGVPRRARLRMSAGSFQAGLVRMFGPGGGRGQAIFLLQLVILAGALAFFPINDDDRRRSLASYGYLCFVVCVPTLLFRTFFPAYATPLRLRVAVLVALALLTTLPDLVHYLVRQPEVLDLGFSYRHLISPFQTIAEWPIVERNGWTTFPFALGWIGVAALINLMISGMRRADLSD